MQAVTQIKAIDNPKIGIIRALQLGDLLCSIPAVRALKKALPDSEITLIGLPWARSFAERFSGYFSYFIEFPGFPGLPERDYHAGRLIRYLKETEAVDFDLIIQMHGNGSIVNQLVAFTEAKRKAGYYLRGNFCPDPDFYIPYPEKAGNEIKRHLTLIQSLGISLQGEHLEFPVTPEEKKQYRNLLSKYELAGQAYVCLHPGARDFKRWWESEKFARIADRIAEKGYRIVLTGTTAEKTLVHSVAGAMQSEAIDLSGKTNPGTLALLIRDATMLFSNDTGVSHIAAAMKTPSIIIFLSSDPERWAPLDRKLHRIIYPEDSDNMDLILRNMEQTLSEIPMKKSPAKRFV